MVKFVNALMYVRSSLRQLHLILHKFSTELFPMINVKKCVFRQYLQSKWLEFYKSLVENKYHFYFQNNSKLYENMTQ